MNKSVAASLAVIATFQWHWPNWGGVLFDATTSISIAEGRIIGAIFYVGAAIVWFLPQPEPK